MNRRDFLRFTGFNTAAIIFSGTGLNRGAVGDAGFGKRPNILFICTDYQAGEDGPSLGSPFLDMPGLDRLCRDGVVFERGYSTAPVCMPERYTWISGQYPHTHGKWGNGDGWLPEGSPLLPELLSKGGYYTLGIGKMHFHPWDRMGGFDRRIIADRKANIEWDSKHQDDYAKFLDKFGLTRWDYLKLSYESETPHVYDFPFPEECHIDHFVGTQAVEVLEKDQIGSGKPWFMWVSFNGPHNPWDPPAKYSQPYMEMDLPAPRTLPDELDNCPMMHTGARYGYTKEVADYIDRYPEKAQGYIKKLRANHYGNLTLIDRQVEKIIAALEKKGQLDNTIIIYSADHGSLLGDHGSFHKGFIYERSARVPFVVHCPKRYRPRRTTAFCGGVDLLPTILSMAGLPIPEAVEGKDLTPVLESNATSVQDCVFIEIHHCIGVITGDGWKLFCHSNSEGEMYDTRNDPDELNNLYLNPAYAGRKQLLQRKLIEFHPEFARQLQAEPPAPAEYDSHYTFKHGDVRQPRKMPYPPAQAGKSLHVRAELAPAADKPLDGAFFACEERIRGWPITETMNGYVLYIKDKRVSLGLRWWNEDTIIESESLLPEGPVTVEADLEHNGTVVLKVNGQAVAHRQAPGFLPLRPGRQELLAPFIHVGVGHKWGKPIGNYDQRQDFVGTVENVELKIS